MPEVACPQLERDCVDCEGTGRTSKEYSARTHICSTCSGTGKELTEYGQLMLEFMKRHLRVEWK